MSLLTLLSLSFIILANGTIYLKAKNQTYPIAPLWLRYQQRYTGIVSGELVSGSNVSSWRNKSAIVLATFTPPIEPVVRSLLSHGVTPTAIVFREATTFLAGKSVFYTDASDSSEIYVPVVALNSHLWDILKKDMLSSNESVYVVLDLSDINLAWEEAYGAQMIAFQVIMVIGSFLCLAIGIWRWTIFNLRSPVIEFNVANVAYGLIVIGAFLRFINSIDIDIRQLYDYRFPYMLFTMSYPFALMVNLLLALFWHEALTLSLTLIISPFLSKLKIPFYICCFLLFGTELATDILRTYNPTVFSPFSSIIHVIGQGLIGFYFVYMSMRVLSFIKTKSKKRVRRTVNYVLVVITCIFIFLAGNSVALWGSSPGRSPYITSMSSHLATFINYTALNIMNIAQSFAFSTSSKADSTDRNSSSRRVSTSVPHGPEGVVS